MLSHSETLVTTWLKHVWIVVQLQRTFTITSSVSHFTFPIVDHTQAAPQIDDGGSERRKPSTPDILSDGTLAIVAGTDTIKSTLAAIFYHLLLNPTCYQRLQREVDEAFPNPEDPMDFKKLGEMEYLGACMYVTYPHRGRIGGLHLPSRNETLRFDLFKPHSAGPNPP